MSIIRIKTHYNFKVVFWNDFNQFIFQAVLHLLTDGGKNMCCHCVIIVLLISFYDHFSLLLLFPLGLLSWAEKGREESHHLSFLAHSHTTNIVINFIFYSNKIKCRWLWMTHLGFKWFQNGIKISYDEFSLTLSQILRTSGSTVAWWLALFPHTKKVLSSTSHLARTFLCGV